MSVHTQVTRQVPIKLISLGSNVRTHSGLDKASIAELAASIKEHGLLQPIVVRPNSEEGFDLIAGQRRTHACIMAGITEVPAVIVVSDNAEAATLQLVENLQREQLSLSETAEAVRSLLALHGKPKTVAEKLNKSAAWVSKHLSLTAPTFNADVRELLASGDCQDLETLLTMNQIAKHPNGGAMLPKLIADISAGDVGRQKVRDALESLKSAWIENGDDEEEGEDEAEDEPKGRATITFELSDSQAKQFEALGGAQWLRRQLKKLTKAAE